MNRLFLLLFGMVTFVAHAQVPDYVPTEGLVAWYPFNGNADDESSNGLDGTVDGAELTEDRTGAASNAYAFDGTDRISTAGSLFIGQTALTFSAWIQSDNPAPYSVLLSEWPAGGATFKLDHSVTDEFLRFDLITSDGFHSASVDFATSQWAEWSHFTAVYDGTTIQLYLDGEAVGAPAPASGSISATAGEMLIGDEANNSAPFQGRLDDIALWGRALTAAEIETVYEASLPNPTATAGVFDGDDHIWMTDADFLNFGQSSFTAHVQFRPTDLSTLNECCGYQTLLAKGAAQGSGNKGFNLDLRGEPDDARINCRITTSQGVDVTVTCPIEEDLWYDMVYIVDWETDTVSLFVNGYLIQQESTVELGNMNNGWYPTIGRFVWNNSNGYDAHYFLGEISRIRVLEGADYEMGLNPCLFRENVVLQVLDFTAEEVAAQVNSSFNIDVVIDVNNPCGGSSATYGCEDPTACNYSEEANLDDGSCIPSGCMEPEACNYNALAECVGEACDYTCCPGPGCCLEGTVWDAELGGCIPIEVTCPEDLDFDGVVGINDLMELLSSFGTMCEEPETVEFTCGDPMNYHGYDYATVQIGEQCWFAENLRTEFYQNGDSIPINLSNSEWTTTSSGARAIFANDSLNLIYHTYNGYAVTDDRKICPINWHVPTDSEWNDLEISLGMNPELSDVSGIRGTHGDGLKASASDNPSWNGSNYTGFGGFPSYGRRGSDGLFDGGKSKNWSSTNSGYDVWLRNLLENNDGVERDHDNPHNGNAVRCIKD